MRFGSGPVRRYQPIGGGAGQTKLTDSQFANRAPALTAEDTLSAETIEPDFVDRNNLDRRSNTLLGSAL
jgi:hypothetical protein